MNSIILFWTYFHFISNAYVFMLCYLTKTGQSDIFYIQGSCLARFPVQRWISNGYYLCLNDNRLVFNFVSLGDTV